jgi:streptogramin lyase
MREWQLPTAWSAPYDAILTKTGEAWTGSMVTDLVSRLDVESEKYTEYLLPRPTNIRRVFVQETGPRPVLWIGSNHGASIIKVETLN